MQSLCGLSRLKSLIRSIGLNPDKYGGHSFRIGGTMLALSLTSDHSLMKWLVDWASSAYLGYNEIAVEQK